MFPASLALVIKYWPRPPVPMMPSRMRSFAPQTRRAAAAVAAPTIKVLREILLVTSILLPWRIYVGLWLQSRDDEEPLHTTNLGLAREGSGISLGRFGTSFLVLGRGKYTPLCTQR